MSKPLVITEFPGWEEAFSSEAEAIVYAQSVVDSSPPVPRSPSRRFVTVYYADGTSGKVIETTYYSDPELVIDLDHLLDIGWAQFPLHIEYTGLSPNKTQISQPEWMALRTGISQG